MADVITTLHPEGAPEDNLYPNVKDENIPSTIARTGDILWENGSQTSPLSSQTVTIADASAYSRICIEYRFIYYGNVAKRFTYFKRDVNKTMVVSDISGGDLYSRGSTLTDYTHLNIEDGYKNGTQSDNACIICAIYGIK